MHATRLVSLCEVQPRQRQQLVGLGVVAQGHFTHIDQHVLRDDEVIVTRALRAIRRTARDMDLAVQG